MRETLTAVRVPPQAIEAEQNVLGILLLDNTAFDRVCDILTEQDFYRLEHRKIFKHIRALIDANMPADPITVSELHGEAREYIATLAFNVGSVSNVRHHALIVQEKAQRRAMIASMCELVDKAYDSPQSAPELAQRAVEQLYGVQSRKSGSRAISDVLTAVIEKIDAMYSRENKHDVVGVATGFVDLDRLTSGLQAGDLIIIAGRPSMGKTALAMNIGEYVAITGKKTVLVFSLEMSDEQLVQRMIGSVGHLDQHELRTGRFPESDWQRVTEATGILNEAPIIIHETSGLTVADVRATAHRTHRETGGLGLIIIDYLQLMQTAGDNRNNELGDVTRALKALAKELRVPVVVLSQLNRGVEQRTNKRPVMSDLRDSGSIESDADLILLIYRDEVYDPESPNKGVAEIIIGKQRSGPIGTIHLTFLAKHARFENFAGEVYRYEGRRRSKPFEVRHRADIDG